MTERTRSVPMLDSSRGRAVVVVEDSTEAPTPHVLFRKHLLQGTKHERKSLRGDRA